MKASYCNITKIPAYNGYQIKLNVPGVDPYQIFFGGICQNMLKECLSERNSLYKKHNILPKGILIKLLDGPNKSISSSSGYRGIYDHCYQEKNGSEIDVFNVSLRNLNTGKPTNRSIRKHHYRSNASAIKYCINLRKANIDCYNSIVGIYNNMLFLDCMKVAKQESIDLRPRLGLFIKFDRERWDRARDTAFPDGFINTIEPVRA